MKKAVTKTNRSRHLSFHTHGYSSHHIGPGRKKTDQARWIASHSVSVSHAGLGDGVTFLSDPFDKETEISGRVAARISLSSSTADADLFLAAHLFAPDMKEQVSIGSQDPFTLVAMGWLRASHCKLDPVLSKPWRPFHSHDEKIPLKPEETVECNVEIWPTLIVVPPRYRFGLTVRDRDYMAPFAQSHLIYDKERQSPNGVDILFQNDGDYRPVGIFGRTVPLHTGPDPWGRIWVGAPS
jgi:uncharacterized protein